MKKILGIALVSAFLIGALAACQQPAAPAAPAAPTAPTAPGQPTPPPPPTPEPPPAEAGLGRGVIVATQNEPPSVAPGQHNAVAGSYMNAMHYNGLFRLDAETLMPVPDLVESWVAVSDTVFEFTIYQGVQFHDGTYMNAHDFIRSWEFVRQFPYGNASRMAIVYFEALDDYTIRIDTYEPNAMLFMDLTHHSNTVMPAALIDAGNDFELNVIGTGPFVFEYWRAGDSVHSVAFDNYFDTARAPRIESVTWRVIPEGASRTIALETGEADYNVYVAFADIARLEADPSVVMRAITGTSHNKLLMNNDLPMFADYRVRRALGMAIDKEAVTIVGMEGFAIPTNSNVPTVFPGATYEGTYTFDPDGALALLAEVGVDPADITFSMIASNDERRRMGEVFQANLAAIGVHVEIEMNDLATTLSRTQQGDYETGFGGFNSATFLGYVRGVLHSNQAIPGGSNRSNFVHPEMDALIDQALVTVDPAARIAIYEQISRVANTYTPHIPTHMAMLTRAWNANLAVPELPATGGLNLNMMFWMD